MAVAVYAPRSFALLLLLGGALPAPAVAESAPALESRISGSVTDEATGQPIRGVMVGIDSADGGIVTSATTNAAGRYATEPLATGPGTYFAYTFGFHGYVDEIYDGISCGSRFCDVSHADATPIEVGAGETVAVDFQLALGGSIAGTVIDEATGDPVFFAEIRVWSAEGQLLGSVPTDPEGEYVFGGLVSGTYYVTTVTAPRYADELYEDLPCSHPPDEGSCDATQGTPVAVTQGVATPGIDFALSRPGSIAGTVTSSSTGQPIASVGVVIWDTDGRQVSSALTNDAGRYRAIGLEPGTYFATTVRRTFTPRGYRHELYDDIPCSEHDVMTCDPTGGTPIPVELGAITTGVSFALDLESGIEGVVIGEESGQPLADVAIDVWRYDANFVRRAVTNAAGRYSVPLLGGVYYVSTDNGQGAMDELYADIPCPGPAREGLCDVLQGTPVEFGPSTVRDDVDFALGDAACLVTETQLCLERRRFRVEVAWRDGAGHTGSGRAVELTFNSGYYWFFSPDNVELVIKVLDGCFEPFDAYWVFAAGLTNVRVEITVTDTATGEVKTYVNPQGRAFQPILDTAAFSTCDAAAPAFSPPGGAAADRRPVVFSKGATCVLEPGLCLNDERFLLEILWRTPDGKTGQGGPVTLTADTGYFWFFSRDNVEVVAKVLDACDLEGFHSFWVFAAGLTNVEVTLRVTDSVSGEVKEYFNPLGRPFRSILDTSAFVTCP